jgi:hypothetical protein
VSAPLGRAADVHCPICNRRIEWNATPPYQLGTDGRPERLVRDPRESENSWQDRLINAYRPCGDVTRPGTHLLPYDYADYRPLTIGMIGHSKAGKTHLLAAMISRLCSNDPALGRLGLRVGPLDLGVHQRYMADCITPLIGRRRELPGTPTNLPVQFCDALKVTNAGQQSFAVTFFDLAGERLTRPNDDEVRFYASAHALVFVVDPESLPRRGSAAGGDASFDVALRRLEARPRPPSAAPLRPVAAAVVVAKADLIRFHDRLPADWLALGSPDEEVALGTIERESEDVYAYLSQRGATPWLRPAQECYRSTLHFASATNGPARDGAFGGAFRQCRVLKPLLAIFAMTGVLDESALQPAGEEPR